MPEAETTWLFLKSKPLATETRMTGSAQVRLSLSVDSDHAQLTPLLVDVAPDGATKTVSRGFLNLQYRHGLAHAEPIPPNERIRASVTFKPQDQAFEPGHRIGVILQGSNTVWAIPEDPGVTYSVTRSALLLPLS
jgi:predicted acyl esterase